MENRQIGPESGRTAGARGSAKGSFCGKTHMKACLAGFLLVLLVCILQPLAVQTHAAQVKAVYSSATKVKISWKKVKKASRYVVYRSARKYGRKQKASKKYKTLGAGVTSLKEKALRRGWLYEYDILACAKNGKVLRQYYIAVFAGSAVVRWDEYQETDTSYTHKEIALRFYVKEGMLPAGYEIERRDLSAGENTFSRICTRKVRKKKITKVQNYIDTAVIPGHRYGYRIRTFRGSGARRINGPWSEEAVMTAARKSPLIAMQVVRAFGAEGELMSDNQAAADQAAATQADQTASAQADQAAVTQADQAAAAPADQTASAAGQTDEAVVLLESDVYNRDLILPVNDYVLAGRYPGSDEKIRPGCRLTGISADGEIWKAASGSIVLAAGEKIYLRFQAMPFGEGGEIVIPDAPVIENNGGVRYGSFVHKFSMNLVSLKVKASFNEAYYRALAQ